MFSSFSYSHPLLLLSLLLSVVLVLVSGLCHYNNIRLLYQLFNFFCYYKILQHIYQRSILCIAMPSTLKNNNDNKRKVDENKLVFVAAEI